jgi:hypothetical protein
MVPKYGLESVIYLDAASDASGGGDQPIAGGKKRAASQRTVEQIADFCASKGIHLFQEVKVSVEVLERKDQRKRIHVRLVQPQIEGFSIVTDCETEIPV